jgi:hemerythrin-like domain-containing protein
MPDLHKPNVGADLARMHAIITRALDVSIEHSHSFAQHGYPDESIREGFVSYVQTFASVLHSHHLTEDEVVFPYFQDKIPDAPFDELTAQHEEMVPFIDQINAAAKALAADPQVSEPLKNLNRALSGVRDLWHLHIQIEEKHLSAEKAEELFETDEQIKLGEMFAQHAQEHSGPDYLVVPFLLHNLSAEERAIFSQGMPPMVTQQLVPIVWKDKWAPMTPFLIA